MYKQLTMHVGWALLLLALAACGGQTAPATSAPSPTAEAPPAEGSAEEPAATDESVTNTVAVSDQSLGMGNTVIIDKVTSDGPGWLVVHAQADGNPGPVLGHAPVQAGDNLDVAVEIDPAAATETLYAMLHVDKGTPGEYEFPGDDVPAADAQGSVVTPAFTLDIPNAVDVSDQPIGADDTVTVAGVTSAGPGWMVIHADADGGPGTVLGHAAVSAGYNENVTVEIDVSAATETLYAMLHVDAGTPGEYEFPGEDGPAMDASGNVVTPPFAVTGGLPGAAGVGLLLADSPALGAYLTDASGMALYTFANDAPGASNCIDRCAENWPPLLVEDGAELAVAADIPGEPGTTVRDDGTTQVTYDGRPLYYWVNDAAPGDTTGHNVGNLWSVARPAPVVFLGGNDDLGRFLVGPNGMTLYRFNNDEPGKSNCTDQCVANWPPLIVEAGQLPTGDAGVVGKLGTAARDDGALQVTYEGMPLYNWANDQAPGDATGQGVNDVWFVVAPYTVGVGNSEELGDFLVAANGMTLYHFTNDEENLSNCTGTCAENWPPLVIQPGQVPLAGFRVTGELGVIERKDGALQVTYGGMPLYFWVNDQAPGDTTGQGVNDVWFVVEP